MEKKRYYQLMNTETLEVYVSQTLDEKPENSLEFYPTQFIKARFDKYPTPTNIIEGATSEEIKNFKKDEIKGRYEQYKIDGWNAYQDFRADLVNEINKGDLTEELAFIIENYLSIAYDKIAQNGDWKTAHYRLTLAEIPQEHSFVEDYKSKALEIIENYININYPKT